MLIHCRGVPGHITKSRTARFSFQKARRDVFSISHHLLRTKKKTALIWKYTKPGETDGQRRRNTDDGGQTEFSFCKKRDKISEFHTYNIIDTFRITRKSRDGEEAAKSRI